MGSPGDDFFFVVFLTITLIFTFSTVSVFVVFLFLLLFEEFQCTDDDGGDFDLLLCFRSSEALFIVVADKNCLSFLFSSFV